METVILYLDFINEDSKIRTLSIEDPKDDLDSQTIGTAMDKIIAADIFEENYIGKKGARYVTKTVEKFDIE